MDWVVPKAVESIANRSTSARIQNVCCVMITLLRLIPLNHYICDFVHALLLIAMSAYMIVLIAALFEKECFTTKYKYSRCSFFNYI